MKMSLNSLLCSNCCLTGERQGWPEHIIKLQVVIQNHSENIY